MSCFSIKKDDYSNNTGIDLATTIQSKGIAILMVIIGHLSIIFNEGKFLESIGGAGVTIFLFLSGYGLTKSFQKSKLNNFFKKRVITVLIPYSFITIIWIILDSSLGKYYTVKTIITAILGFDLGRSIDGTMWYISYILMWYIMFYFIFRITKSDNLKMFLMFFVSGLSIIIWKYNLIGSGSYQWGLHSLGLPIGVFFAFYEIKVLKKITIKLMWLLILTGIFMLLINDVIGMSNGVYYFINDNLVALITISLMIIIRIKNGSVKLLHYIGKYSYELYLLEGYLMQRVLKASFVHGKLLSLALYILTLLLTTYIFSKLLKFINSKYEQRKLDYKSILEQNRM